MRARCFFGSAQVFSVLVASMVLAASASAATIGLSTHSSDETPAGQLDASLEFTITDTSELTLTVTNTTDLDGGDNDAEFLMNGVWFNAASNVSGLTLDSAMHSDAGDVFSDWTPVVNDASPDGFGTFDFGVDDGTGMTNPSLIGAGEYVTFVFTITGTGPYSASDFVAANSMDYLAAAKFVSCTGTDCVSVDDSAFGATIVPEPGTGLLVGMGLVGMALRRRERA